MKTLTKDEYDTIKCHDRSCKGNCVVGRHAPGFDARQTISTQLYKRGYLVSIACEGGGPCNHWCLTSTGKMAVYCYELAHSIIKNALTES